VFDSISKWCIKHIGRALPITYKKNPSMHELWDDRAVQVIRNEGITPEEKALQDKRLRKEILRVGILPLEINPARHGKLQLVGSQLMRAVYLFLVSAGQQAAKAAFQKAKEFNKITGDPDEISNAAFSAIDWKTLANNVNPDLLAAVEVGMSDGIAQLELKQDSDYVQKFSSEYAQTRSAEMIGKRLVDGKLVDNPDARYAISETTRDDLRDVIANAIETNLPLEELESSIKMAGI